MWSFSIKKSKYFFLIYPPIHPIALYAVACNNKYNNVYGWFDSS